MYLRRHIQPRHFEQQSAAQLAGSQINNVLVDQLLQLVWKGSAGFAAA